MQKSIPTFPKSFPNPEETRFLEVLLASDESFPSEFASWCSWQTLDTLPYVLTRLLPLMYLRARKLGVVSPHLGRLAGIYKLAWVTNQRLFDAAGTAIAVLEAQGIQVIVLKGMALMSLAYKDAGARFSGDADILIDPMHVSLAVRTLLDAGWKLRHCWHPEFEHFSQERIAATVKEITFIDSSGNELDVHIRLYEDVKGRPEAIPFSELLAHSVPFEFRGRTYRSLATSHMLAHVIAHGAVGNIERGVRWVADAAYIMQACVVDWELFLSVIERYGFECEASFAAKYFLLHGLAPNMSHNLTRVAALPCTKAKLRAYRSRAKRTIPYPMFGNIPRLWHEYWKFEADGFSPQSLYGFTQSMCRAWGLKSLRDLPSFVVSKYSKRVWHFIRRA